MGFAVKVSEPAYFEDATIQALTLGSGQIEDAHIASGSDIDADKLQHRHILVYQQADGSDVTSTSGDGVPIFVGTASGGYTIESVTALSPDAPSGDGTESITVDLLEADDDPSAAATVLTSTAVIDKTVADYEPVAAVINATKADRVTGDVLMVKVTVAGTGGTQGQGLLVQVVVVESGA